MKRLVCRIGNWERKERIEDLREKGGYRMEMAWGKGRKGQAQE